MAERRESKTREKWNLRDSKAGNSKTRNNVGLKQLKIIIRSPNKNGKEKLKA